MACEEGAWYRKEEEEEKRLESWDTLLSPWVLNVVAGLRGTKCHLGSFNGGDSCLVVALAKHSAFLPWRRREEN